MNKAQIVLKQLTGVVEASIYQWVKGDRLSPELQKKVLQMFVHRFTGEHKPAWANKPRPDGTDYPVQHATDQGWLKHTEFALTKQGDLDNRNKYSRSTPSWPKNPELRKNS